MYNQCRAGDLSAEGGRLLEDRAVALRAQQGDTDAFEELVRRYEEVAFRVAYLIVREEADAQDVAQEAFLRAYRSLDRYDAGQPFRPWLLRIVTNLALNNRRSARRRDALSERAGRDETQRRTATSAEATVIRSEEAEQVWEAIGTLRAEEQTVLYLRYFLEASEQETAEAIGRPAGTVKSRLHRALRRLRGVIEDRYPDLAMAIPSEAGERTQ